LARTLPSGTGTEKIDYYELALAKIPEIIQRQKVVTEREIKVRLEPAFPWLVGHALHALVSQGLIKEHGYKGRRPAKIWAPTKFYALKETEYSEIELIIKDKIDVSKAVNAQLTGRAVAAYFAEDLFDEALEKVPLNFRIHKRNASEFGERRVVGRERGPPPDLDFICEKDSIVYGIDIKNWIRFESDTIPEVKKKVDAALQLDIVPFIITRYMDKSTAFTEIVQKGGLVYQYMDLLFPMELSSLAQRAEQLLGYPIRCVDSLPLYMSEYILELHNRRRASHT